MGIIGNPPTSYTILPITEEDYSAVPDELPKICGYEAKWSPTSPYWNIKSIPAVLPDETEKTIEECCIRLSERLECRDYTRFDWRLDSEGNPKLLEVNPNPGKKGTEKRGQPPLLSLIPDVARAELARGRFRHG
jgi:D-alanine-D-alanine ligase